jgi:hypothetical protein
MGRKKKGSNTKSEVDSFSVDKGNQLEVFSHKTPSLLTKDIIAKYDIKPVRGTNNLRGAYLESFTQGKNYDEALKLAYEWRDRFNTRKNAISKIELIDYYPQEFKGKSIIISYKIV